MADALNSYGYSKYCVHGSHALDVSEEEAQHYEAKLEAATDEKPLQGYLALHPQLLAVEDSGECRWVIPQQSLNGKFFPDFLVGRLDSPGLKWVLVELQSPRAQLFTQKGEPAAQLREGINQIERWRRWLENNLDEARRPPSLDGLGLIGINHASRGLVLIGRSSDRNDEIRERLWQLTWRHQIAIRSYDWLAREARKRIRERNDFGPGRCEECQRAAG